MVGCWAGYRLYNSRLGGAAENVLRYFLSYRDYGREGPNAGLYISLQ